MKLATDHIEGMLATHHPVRFERVIIAARIGHRALYMHWLPGAVKDRDALGALAEYKGYRCIDASINGLTSRYRLVKGTLTAAQEYRIKLETHTLTAFNYDDHYIRMEFVPRIGDRTLDSFETTKLAFLETIKDYGVDCGSDSMNLTIKSFHPKKGHRIPTTQFHIPEGPRCESFNNLMKEIRVAQALRPEDWTKEADSTFADVNIDPFKSLNAPRVTLSEVEKEKYMDKSCPDCKDGYYYPFSGPKEPCQTCAKSSQIGKNLAQVVKKLDQTIETTARTLVELFVKEVAAHLTGGTHMFKDPMNRWETCVTTIQFPKGDSLNRVALNAGCVMAHTLMKKYPLYSLAFEDQRMLIPPSVVGTTKVATLGAVSARLNLQKIAGVYDCQFELKVSP